MMALAFNYPLNKERGRRKRDNTDVNNNNNNNTRKNPQKIGKWTRRLRKKKASGDHPDCSTIMIGQNTEKSSGDLLSLKLQCKTIS